MIFQTGKNRTITITAITMATLLGFFSSNCEKVEPVRVILIETGIDIRSYTNLLFGFCNMFDVGGGTGVDQHGFCVSLTANVNECLQLFTIGRKKSERSF